VYHFSYHRLSLLALLDLFLLYARQDKHIYILAGNHDRLGQHFVYAEAEKILYHHNHNNHHIHFITQPCIKQIEDQNVIFMPYLLSRSGYTPQSESYDFDDELMACRNTSHPQTHASYLLNCCISDMLATLEIQNNEHQIDDHSNNKTILIHHYYTANTRFPGIKAVFGYKDIAISPHRLDHHGLRIIS
jgi:hypothetical protein